MIWLVVLMVVLVMGTTYVSVREFGLRVGALISGLMCALFYVSLAHVGLT